MMDKHKLRQAAVNDFMQSLEQLDELLGDMSETVALDDSPQSSEANQPKSLPLRSPQPVSPKAASRLDEC